jgi:hypothetical protein
MAPTRLSRSKRHCHTWLGSHFRALPAYIKRGCAALLPRRSNYTGGNSQARPTAHSTKIHKPTTAPPPPPARVWGRDTHLEPGHGCGSQAARCLGAGIKPVTSSSSRRAVQVVAVRLPVGIHDAARAAAALSLRRRLLGERLWGWVGGHVRETCQTTGAGYRTERWGEPAATSRLLRRLGGPLVSTMEHTHTK